MTMLTLRAAAVGLLLAGAAPALAQPPAPAETGARASPEGQRGHHWRGRGGERGMMGRAFASLSPEGRTIMRDAMRSGVDRRENREAVRAARDRMLAVLDSDRLDTAALKRAMDDERQIVNSSRERTQASMLAAFGKLSVADRKAFVADARQLKQRMEARVKAWRDRGGPGGPEGGPDGLPPPSGF